VSESMSLNTHTHSPLITMSFIVLLYLRVWAISGQSRRLAVFLVGNLVVSFALLANTSNLSLIFSQVVFGVSIVMLILYIKDGECEYPDTQCVLNAEPVVCYLIGGPKVTIASGCISRTRGTRDILITLVFALLLYSGISTLPLSFIPSPYADRCFLPAVTGLSVYFGLRFHRISRPGPLLVMFYRDGTIYFVVVVGPYFSQSSSHDFPS
jgi:hypothetical protein